jgi:hypothetical protein
MSFLAIVRLKENKIIWAWLLIFARDLLDVRTCWVDKWLEAE